MLEEHFRFMSIKSRSLGIKISKFSIPNSEKKKVWRVLEELLKSN